MGDESPQSDDGFWSADAETTSRAARTLRLIRPPEPEPPPRVTTANDRSVEWGPARLAKEEERLATLVMRSNSKIENYRAQRDATRNRTDWRDAMSHPIVVAVGSLAFFTLIAMLWWPDPVARPPVTDPPPAFAAEPRPAALVPAVSTPPAEIAQRPVGTAGSVPIAPPSAATPPPQAAVRAAPDSGTLSLPQPASARQSGSSLSATSGAPDGVARLAAGSAAAPSAAPTPPEVTAASAAPDLTAAPPLAAAPPPAPFVPVPDAPAPSPAVAAVAPASAAPSASVETPQVPAQQSDQRRADLAPPRVEETQPPPAPPAAAGIREAVLVSGPLPRYPESVKRMGQAGAVDVDVTIDTRGRVRQAEALNGPQALRAFAEDAVRQWRYEPALASGTPVESRRRVRIVFR